MCGEVSGFVKSGDGTTTGRLLDTRDGAFMEYAQSNTQIAVSSVSVCDPP
jgi:hypothetical protein